MIELPGSELIEAGLSDLGLGKTTIESLLVSIGAPRLRKLGYRIDKPLTDPEHRLYLLLREQEGDGAHSSYNALLRRLISFERAAEQSEQKIPGDAL